MIPSQTASTISGMPTHNKMTILPLHYWDWKINMPVQLSADLMAENIEGLLTPSNFELWHEYVSKKDRDNLSSARLGIVHRFSSQGLLPMVDLIEQSRLAIDELIDVAGRATIEAVLPIETAAVRQEVA